jgi:predicted Zn finger-like uncharacterized protein
VNVSLWNPKMQIIVQCPECKKTWRVDGVAADRRVSCKKCGTLFKVPKLEDVPKAAQVIKQAKSDIYVDEDGKIFG